MAYPQSSLHTLHTRDEATRSPWANGKFHAPLFVVPGIVTLLCYWSNEWVVRAGHQNTWTALQTEPPYLDMK